MAGTFRVTSAYLDQRYQVQGDGDQELPYDGGKLYNHCLVSA